MFLLLLAGMNPLQTCFKILIGSSIVKKKMELCHVFLAVYSLFFDKDITHSLPHDTRVIKGLNRTKDQLYIIDQWFSF